MVTAKDVSYKFVEFEGKTISQVQEETYGSVLIWIVGSAFYGSEEPSEYNCLLEYKGYTKHLHSAIKEKTANGIMVEGILAAAERINKASDVIVISATSLGVQKAFKGSGPNAHRIQDFLEILNNKECTLTEGRYTNGVRIIKNHIKNHG